MCRQYAGNSLHFILFVRRNTMKQSCIYWVKLPGSMACEDWMQLHEEYSQVCIALAHSYDEFNQTYICIYAM